MVQTCSKSTLQDKKKIFISSSQTEFGYERQLLKFLIENDEILGRFFSIFVFEKDGGPNPKIPRDVYITAVKSCDIYIGLFGKQLRDAVKEEFQSAENKGRYIFIDANVQADDALERFLNFIKGQVTYYSFNGFEDLKNRIFETLNRYLDENKS